MFPAMANLKLLVILSVALSGFSVSAFVKGSPFQYEYKDKLYHIETAYKASFYRAFMDCSAIGMDLWSIDSDEEFDTVHSFLKDKKEYKQGFAIWTSGAMRNVGQFYWMTNGNPVQSSRWWPGEPNNHEGREHCLHIWFYNEFLLNDFFCDQEAYFICESKKLDIKRL